MADAAPSSPVGTGNHYYANAGKIQTSSAVLAKLAQRSSLTPDSAKLILAMVGLPARGKSFISHKLFAFLNWSGTNTQIFNAGQKRRRDDDEPAEEPAADEPAAEEPAEPAAKKGPAAEGRAKHSAASFFDPSDATAKAGRDQIAMQTLDELLAWFDGGGEIGIFDATNSTRGRRAAVLARASAYGERTGQSVSVVFIESICDEVALLEANMLAKVRASPDFASLSEAEALADLRERIGHYERAYETVEDSEGAYIKLYNLSSKVSANQVFGRMSTRVLPYLTALHIRERPVYLAALLPSDCASGCDGSFADKLARWVHAKAGDGAADRLRLLSSTQAAAITAAETVARGGGVGSTTHQSGLNPIDRGAGDRGGAGKLEQAVLKGMQFHERFAGGGESFADLVRRLEPCLLEIEASMEPVLVIAHKDSCRALRAYFKASTRVAECMGEASSEGARALANEAHKVVELWPTVGGGNTETIVDLELI